MDISPTSDAGGGESREHLIGTLPARDFPEKKKKKKYREHKGHINVMFMQPEAKEPGGEGVALGREVRSGELAFTPLPLAGSGLTISHRLFSWPL